MIFKACGTLFYARIDNVSFATASSFNANEGVFLIQLQGTLRSISDSTRYCADKSKLAFNFNGGGLTKLHEEKIERKVYYLKIIQCKVVVECVKYTDKNPISCQHSATE